MDVGHVSQTFQLSTTAHGLQTWITGAFNDDKISKILNINSREESPMFFLGAGRGNGHSIPRDVRDRLVEK
jgi:nitroreductase